MRASLPLVLILVVSLLLLPGADAQLAANYVVLYAHSNGSSTVLNALSEWGGQKSGDIRRGIVFTLNPALGADLAIHGAITFTMYLRAVDRFSGTITLQLSEISSRGTELLVPGAIYNLTSLSLTGTILPITVGVGPVDYQFKTGSAILLHITVDQQFASGIPLLIWDTAVAPTNIRLAVVTPMTTKLSFVGRSSYGRIFQTDSTGQRSPRIDAAVTDAIGAYHIANASFTLTGGNAKTNFHANVRNSTDYTNFYSLNSTLSEGKWQVDLTVNDLSGNAYTFTSYLWVSRFTSVLIEVVGSDGSPIANATLQASAGGEASWNATTDASGKGTLSLPLTSIVGPIGLTVIWHGTRTNVSLPPIDGPSTFRTILPRYNVDVRIMVNTPFLMIPVPTAQVSIYQKGPVQQTITGLDGFAALKAIPAGNYTVRVDYLFSSYESMLNVKENSRMTIVVPFPHPTRTLALIATTAAVVGVASVVAIRRKRNKVYPASFDYFNELSHGGLPDACFTVISGNSGSGKSVLLNTLAAKHVEVGRSIYITNMEYPDKIRDSLTKLGISGNPSAAFDGRLIFIDAYSAIGGGSSKEEYSVTSHTDLTNLGLMITKCLERAGPRADVYLDSLNPLLTMLRIDYLINFLQAVAARVKANNGKLCITVGAGIDKEDLTKLEESSDCIIETQLQELGRGQRRRLRIKKLRDKPYNDRWTRFQVESGKGIIFLTTSKQQMTDRVS